MLSREPLLSLLSMPPARLYNYCVVLVYIAAGTAVASAVTASLPSSLLLRLSPLLIAPSLPLRCCRCRCWHRRCHCCHSVAIVAIAAGTAVATAVTALPQSPLLLAPPFSLLSPRCYRHHCCWHRRCHGVAAVVIAAANVANTAGTAVATAVTALPPSLLLLVPPFSLLSLRCYRRHGCWHRRCHCVAAVVIAAANVANTAGTAVATAVTALPLSPLLLAPPFSLLSLRCYRRHCCWHRLCHCVAAVAIAAGPAVATALLLLSLHCRHRHCCWHRRCHCVAAVAINAGTAVAAAVTALQPSPLLLAPPLLLLSLRCRRRHFCWPHRCCCCQCVAAVAISAGPTVAAAASLLMLSPPQRFPTLCNIYACK